MNPHKYAESLCIRAEKQGLCHPTEGMIADMLGDIKFNFDQEKGSLERRNAELTKEIAGLNEALAITNRSADDQMFQKREAEKQVSELTKERDAWKASHDNQVNMRRALMDRPDLKDRAKSIERLTARIAELEKEKARCCEHCGSNRVIDYAPVCPMCGAPNCCSVCCKITRLEDQLTEARKDGQRLDWLLEYITQHGADGIGDLEWTIIEEEEGDAIMERASIAFDRPTIDRAMHPEPKEGK